MDGGKQVNTLCTCSDKDEEVWTIMQAKYLVEKKKQIQTGEEEVNKPCTLQW